MAEYKLFEGKTHHFSTVEWYEDRPTAQHLEEAGHRERLLACYNMALPLIQAGKVKTISDVGCGDGGLISLFKDQDVKVWGYDAAPSNIAYARNVRGVDVYFADAQHESGMTYGNLTFFTEVLEHVNDPHLMLRDCPSKYVIASSPYVETDEAHYEFHLWAWDEEGYRELLKQAGYTVIKEAKAFINQIMLGERRAD